MTWWMSGHGGAVASEHELVSEAALAVLRQGGNAVDAAVAGAAVQGVCRPFSGGLGGGGFMLIHRPGAEPVVIEHREQAAGAFGPHSFFDDSGRELTEGQRRVSCRSVGVPGAPKAWDEAVTRYGRLSLADALAPAILLARAGFTVDPTLHREISDRVDDLRLFAPSRRLFLTPDSEPLPTGGTLRNPDLASAYELIAERGSRVCYEGPIADAIIAAVTDPPTTGDGARVQRGQLTKVDFAGYTTHHLPPTRGTYRGLTVLGAPPPSSGGITVTEALNILEGYPLGALPDADAFHYYLEACRLAFADRDTYIGDPAFVEVPVEGLTSKRFAAQRRGMVGEKAISGLAPAGEPAPSTAPRSYTEDGSCTIHLTVADGEGGVVSYTNTIVSMGGTGLVVPSFGFLLNDAVAARTAGRAGPRGATAPHGGIRPLSSMAPTVLLRDGSPVLALGSPAGSTIITTVLQVIVGVVDLGWSLADAVSAPRVSQRNMDGGVALAEPAFFDAPMYDALLRRGHAFSRCTWPEGIGAVNALRWSSDGTVEAVAEPWRRGGGCARVEAAA